MNFKRSLISILAIGLLYVSCDEAEELNEFRLTEDFTTTVNVDLSENSMGAAVAIDESRTISLTESPEISDYLELIKDVDILSLSYEIDNYSGVENGTITEASVSFNGNSIGISDINLQLADENNSIYEIDDTDFLSAVAAALENDGEVTLGLTGSVNETPVVFDIVVTLETSVTVELL